MAAWIFIGGCYEERPLQGGGLGLGDNMGRGEIVHRIGAGLVGLAGCCFLAGCGAGGTAGFETPRPNTFSLSSLGNLVAFNTLFPSSTPLPQNDSPVECPTIEVLDGTASVRVYSGGDRSNDHVRYGFALGDIARECSKAGDMLVLKVGAEGRVLLGPSGSPGSFTVPLRIAVRNDVTQKVLTSQLNSIPASIGSGETQAAFTFVSEPFSVPLVRHPDEDYVILVGFDPNGRGVNPATNPRKPHKR